MPLELECVAGAIPGKRFPVQTGSPQIFRMYHHGQETGTVVVELLDGQCVVTNRSPHPVLVNDSERSRSTLANGDRLAVGRDIFIVRADDRAEGVTTQAVTNNAYAPHGRSRACTVCGGPFLPVTGWTDGTQALCADCIAKGHSPRSLGSAPALAPRPPPVPASDRQRPILAGSSQRQRRTVSASMKALDQDGAGSLLGRLRGLLAGRRDRRRLAALAQERRELLQDAGRHALSQAFLGLPEEALNTLLAGRSATIDPLDLSRAGIDRWRAARERLALLDAEIAALRSRLGLGPDPERRRAAEVNLRAKDQERVDRVFATLDGMSTMELDPVTDSVKPATAGEIRTAPLSPKPGRRTARST